MRKNSPRRLILILAASLLVGRAFAADPVDVLPVGKAGFSQSLGGPWHFKHIASTNVGADENFFLPGFDIGAWSEISVPGHWELHGFAEPKYKRVDEGTGLYRRTFRIPSGWDGGRVMLRFDGVLYGLTAWVNGVLIGEWASSYNPVTFDITDALRRDGDNTLAVRVTTRSKGWEFDTNDCWALSGIYREVTLLHVPTAHLQDYVARTTLRADGGADLQLTAVATGAGQVTAQLTRPDGSLEREWAFATDAAGRGASTVTLPQPRLWTAETPSLYGLRLAFTPAGGGEPHVVVERLGVREVSIDQGVLKLNGTAIKLRGVNHHEIWPDEGRVATEARLRRDLEMMRAANINFVRTSHYPPHPRLVELCDEMGVYVMCEVPFGFGDRNLTDPTFAPVLKTRARATVRRDQNRPSVIIWSIGNENPLTELGVQTAGYTRELDPTRPVCIPTVGSYFSANIDKFIALPGFVRVFAPHYPGKERAQDYAKRLDRPIIFTEFSHALGLAFDLTESLWDIFEKNPRIAGGAVWMFQDQGIKRRLDPANPPKNGAMYVWPDAQHYYDTAGTDGCDGLVYSDRTPQVDYWQLRKVYAPVRVVERSLSVRPGAQDLRLTVRNHHDFRSLAGLTLRWTLHVNGKPHQVGDVPLSAAARSFEQVALRVDVPPALASDFCWLAVSCVDASGRALTEQSVRLLAAETEPLEARLVAGAPAAELKLGHAGAEMRVVHPDFTVVLRRDTGAVQIVAPDGRVLVAGIGPHAGRRFTLAETLRLERERRDATESALRDGVGSIWTGVPLLPTKLELAEATLESGRARIVVRGTYARMDRAAHALAGGFTLEVSPSGAVAVSYSYQPVNAGGTLLEAGLAFELPPPASEFRWVGAGPYAGYPGKEMLNEFGRHHLSARDLHFNGNRRGVQVATLTAPDGRGVALVGAGVDVAVETSTSGVTLSQNAVVAGRGNKGGSPETQIQAAKVESVRGQFTLLPLSQAWPEALARWLGSPSASVPVLTPFLRSYDQ